ncbi:glycoside hydrolase family 55 protein [Actinospica acidithermotolerans]|nr:glycoside hydrolase family 55 protein [Actinospica acidithermotolerans]
MRALSVLHSSWTRSLAVVVTVAGLAVMPLTASAATAGKAVTSVGSAATQAKTTSSSTVAASTTGGVLGSNVYIFDPSMSQASIQSTLDAIAAQQVPNQFGTQRYALLFEPGTYGSAADPLVFQVGYYTSVAGLGKNPGDTTIVGQVDTFNQCTDGDQSQCYALENFWRSMSNLTIDAAGGSGCTANTEFWAVSQAAPMRRVAVNGNVTLMDYCDGSPDYASGGFIADSSFTGGTVINGSQQQYITRNSSLDGWTNGVWNQVFCGDSGAPAQSFSATSGLSNGTAPYTTLATCPTTREEPYLYTDSSGNLEVFIPSAQTNSSGTTWSNGGTAGYSLPLSRFFIVQQSTTVHQMNAALARGLNLLFTPGVYDVPSTIHILYPDTKVIGLGFPTLIPTNGNVTMDATAVPGVNISGLIFDAGTESSPTLLDLHGIRGLAGLSVYKTDPTSVDDVFFRVGGATAGTAKTAFADDASDSIIDDVWAWRADHGAGAGTWTGDQADTGVTVGGDDVTAYGLAVEHFQKYETVWSGQNGTVIFFQNENPYEVPNQASWMATPTQNGYPGFYVTNRVTSFQGYGMGVYSYFDQGVAIESSMAFEAPDTPGVQFHDILTRFLNGSGGIQSVINGTGAAVDSDFNGPADLVSYP